MTDSRKPWVRRAVDTRAPERVTGKLKPVAGPRTSPRGLPSFERVGAIATIERVFHHGNTEGTEVHGTSSNSFLVFSVAVSVSSVFPW
jgi:hypothetical protein